MKVMNDYAYLVTIKMSGESVERHIVNTKAEAVNLVWSAAEKSRLELEIIDDFTEDTRIYGYYDDSYKLFCLMGIAIVKKMRFN